MQLAFVLYKYFPFGGLQRDFMRIALECQQRGHQIRVYTLIWEGDIQPGFEVLVAPVKAFFNHRRNEKLSAWMAADLAKRPVDRLIGFNKMPGLDVYYAADGCFEDKAQNLRHSLYRYFGRYQHFAEYERAVNSTGTGFIRPPSTRIRPLTAMGVKTPGIEIEARIAVNRSPD